MAKAKAWEVDDEKVLLIVGDPHKGDKKVSYYTQFIREGDSVEDVKKRLLRKAGYN